MTPNSTFTLYTLGCKLNFAEGTTISRQFKEKGFEEVSFHQGADVCVINTCSVTDHADKKCKKLVKEALKANPNSYVIIIGCYAQLKPEEISQINGVDAVLGANEKFRIFENIETFEKNKHTILKNEPIQNTGFYTSSFSLEDRTRSFLKVQDGCDYNCAFCTIPLARGRSRSAEPDQIIENAYEIARSGIKEIVLTGVNIGDYGLINNKREYQFLELLKALDEIDGIERIRISSIEPNLLENETIEFVKDSNKFLPHLHIPLQSGSDKILKLMRRRYLSGLYSERVTKIKSLMPNACIGVDVITGFPEESNEDFLTTYEFLNKLDISYLHVFTYSVRANTKAERMKNHVKGSIKKERSDLLRILSEKKRRKFYESQIGSSRKVLFESENETSIFGWTENYIRVSVDKGLANKNEIRTVKLQSINSDGTVKALLSEEQQLA